MITTEDRIIARRVLCRIAGVTKPCTVETHDSDDYPLRLGVNYPDSHDFTVSRPIWWAAVEGAALGRAYAAALRGAK